MRPDKKKEIDKGHLPPVQQHVSASATRWLAATRATNRIAHAGRTRPNRGIPRLGKLLKGARMQGGKKREQEGKLLIASLHLMAV